MLGLQVMLLLTIVVSCSSVDLLKAIAGDDEAAIVNALASTSNADLNKRGIGGQTPLMYAVLTGKPNAVRLLLESGADVNIGEKDGYTPMHGAGFQGRADIVKILSDAGVPVNSFHTDGYLPLHRACWGLEKRHTDTVLAFLEVGARTGAKSKGGTSCAQMTKNEATQRILKKWKKREEREGLENNNIDHVDSVKHDSSNEDL